MKTIIFNIKDFERPYLIKANKLNHELTFEEQPLNEHTVSLAAAHKAVVVFTNDDVSATVLKHLQKDGINNIAIRAVGYDNIDIKTAFDLHIKCANVPEYSPYAIAEHAVALILCLNRKIITADRQVHQQNFSVGNLVGFDLFNKTVGIIGTGRTGSIAAKILNGFGCKLLAFDLAENDELIKKYNLQYVDLDALCRASDIITLHTPLNSGTKYLIDREKLLLMKKGAMLINTARGAIIHTEDVIHALDDGTIGYLGMDVYEKEKGIFFYDHSENKIEDNMLMKLMNYPNVIITPHQAFATHEALTNIADTTFYNLDQWSQQLPSENELT